MNKFLSILMARRMLLLVSCNTVRGLSSASRWSYDPSNGQIVDQQAHVQWHFTDDPASLQNASDFSYGARFVTMDTYEAYHGKKFVKSIVNDLPFSLDSLCWVYADGMILFETNGPVYLRPDYAIQADSVVMNLHGEIFRADAQQHADIVWRNLIIPRGHHRLLCVDRFRRGNRYFALVYVAQSECTSLQLKRWVLEDWNLLSWDVSDPRNMQTVADFLDYWGNLSAEILGHHAVD